MQEPSSSTKETRREYVVLARRYRPSRFEEVIGQEHVTRTLQNAITSERVHHAYLFTGSRGVGKTTVARILARALNHPDGPTASPPPLDKNDDQQSVDVIEIDGASHTGVDNVRELRESVRYLPSKSRYKIYIIDEVHMLSTGAFNALLKTLEEPPPHVIFVFATTEPHKIPATILSRCQRFDFKRVPTTTLVEHLENLTSQEGIKVEKAGLALIARAAEGGVRDSLSLLDQVIAYAASDDELISAKMVADVLGVADRRVLFALSAAIFNRDAAAALSTIDNLFRDGHDLSQVAQAFTMHLRDLIVAASCNDPAPLIDATEAELDELIEQAKSVELSLLQQHFDRFAHATEEITRSMFPRLLFEMVLVELVYAEPLLPLGDLLERLESLERGLPPAPRTTTPIKEQSRIVNKDVSAPAEPKIKERVEVKEPVHSEDVESEKKPANWKPPLNFEVPASVKDAEEKKKDESVDSVANGIEEIDSASIEEEKSEVGVEEVETRSIVEDRVDASAVVIEENPSEPMEILAPEALRERWHDILAHVGPPISTTFACGRLLGFKDGIIELGYKASDEFELKRAQDTKRCDEFIEKCQDILKSSIKIHARALTAEEENATDLKALSAIEAKEVEEKERREELTEEAKAHPITRTFIDEFGAKIVAIQTDIDH